MNNLPKECRQLLTAIRSEYANEYWFYQGRDYRTFLWHSWVGYKCSNHAFNQTGRERMFYHPLQEAISCKHCYLNSLDYSHLYTMTIEGTHHVVTKKYILLYRPEPNIIDAIRHKDGYGPNVTSRLKKFW